MQSNPLQGEERAGRGSKVLQRAGLEGDLANVKLVAGVNRATW